MRIIWPFGSDLAFHIIQVQSRRKDCCWELTHVQMLSRFLYPGRTRSVKPTSKVGIPCTEVIREMTSTYVQTEENIAPGKDVSVQTETIPQQYITASTQTEEVSQQDDDIMQELRSLREEVKRLRGIREDEAYIDGIVQELSQITERARDGSPMVTPGPSPQKPTVGVQEMDGDTDSWQLVTSSTGKRRRPRPPFTNSSPSYSFSHQDSSTSTPHLNLKNRFQVLQEETTNVEQDQEQHISASPGTMDRHTQKKHFMCP
uniref:Uncharacterized protein LOC117351839 n=1 Tax=Geotrypetes seraphini TaxID=260995 RepID=A0A6P8Q9L6_GEOSA|nr:uncharacterized protein LOC117351839 [Geotrypetes seraphini]